MAQACILVLKSFEVWMNQVNRNLNLFGLFIDESDIKDVGEYIPFMDIQYCFDIHGQLQTDLYVRTWISTVPTLETPSLVLFIPNVYDFGR